MRRFPRFGSVFRIAAAGEMLADGPRLLHSVASDLAQASNGETIAVQAPRRQHRLLMQSTKLLRNRTAIAERGH
jgi:hypothetical protein